MLIVGLCGLPGPAGHDHVQGLIDHFFLDVEDRIRLVLAPAPPALKASATSTTPPPSQPPARTTPGGLAPFYTPRNAASTYSRSGVAIPVHPAPERLVGQQMGLFRAKWAGMGLAQDPSLVSGNADFAAALWWNVLTARGARGIVFPRTREAENRSCGLGEVSRSINIVGGSESAVRKVDLMPGGVDAAERQNDGSGLHDYPPSEADKYVEYPEFMHTLMTYAGRELVRLEALSDAEVLEPLPDADGVLYLGSEREGADKLRFGRMRE